MAHLTARDRVEALRAVRALALRVIDSLTPQEWAADSAAEGWTVHDVVAHMSSAQRELFGALLVKVATSKDIEALNETPVGVRRHLARREGGRRVPPVGTAGTPGAGTDAATRGTGFGHRCRWPNSAGSPARVLPSAIAFDTHTHLYHDIAPALSRPGYRLRSRW